MYNKCQECPKGKNGLKLHNKNYILKFTDVILTPDATPKKYILYLNYLHDNNFRFFLEISCLRNFINYSSRQGRRNDF